MKEYDLGEFEEIVLLTVAVLHDDAYGVAIKAEIQAKLNRTVSIGAMQTALRRMETKGYLTSTFGEATAIRGGKRKRYFKITAYGLQALEQYKQARNTLWAAIPSPVFDTMK